MAAFFAAATVYFGGSMIILWHHTDATLAALTTLFAVGSGLQILHNNKQREKK